MASVKISSKIEESVWQEIRQLAAETDRSISGILTDALRDYLTRRRVRPAVIRHLEDSMNEHEDLGRRLAE